MCRFARQLDRHTKVNISAVFTFPMSAKSLPWLQFWTLLDWRQSCTNLSIWCLNMGMPCIFNYYNCNEMEMQWIRIDIGLSWYCKFISNTLEWRHNERESVSNHQLLDGLLNRLSRRRSKKTSKLCVTGLCEGNLPVNGEFPRKGPITRKMFSFDDVMMRDNGRWSLIHAFHELHYGAYNNWQNL